MKGPPSVPTATYRLQFSGDFTFRDAAQLVPYLSELGVSHCYASPYLKARPGSPHGYDITDHSTLNPEIGDGVDYQTFIRTLHDHGMGQLLDFVPNHMGIGPDNAWWWDVIENGQASEHAPRFDIDWNPVQDELRGKVLLPVLGDHYGLVLERGEITVELDPGLRGFQAAYHDQRFPLDPSTYPLACAEAFQNDPGGGDRSPDELQAIVVRFGELPSRDAAAGDPELRARRSRDLKELKNRLCDLLRCSPSCTDRIRGGLKRIGGAPGNRASFDGLHALLESQAYRLAYWRSAADVVNYRRFFEINDLVGLRVEDPDTFDATHRFVLELIENGAVDGLRIDHPDGLLDPAEYLRVLRRRFDERMPQDRGTPFLVVEKILATGEPLRNEWPVEGTTGYEFMNLLAGLFVDPRSEPVLGEIYQRLTGRERDFDGLVAACKRSVIRKSFGADLFALATTLRGLAAGDRRTRDFTWNQLCDALVEVAARFPVYRTYVTRQGPAELDVLAIEQAVNAARGSSGSSDTRIFDFIRSVLLLEFPERTDDRDRALRFVMRFQQFTAPVMAKGFEDTALYRDRRLVSLNEVGGDPMHFGTTVEEFHRANAARRDRWPYSLLSTSTHDTKRSEDVRARISVLSEIPEEWGERVEEWVKLNGPLKTRVRGMAAPASGDEYLLYQILVGAWPLHPVEGEELDQFRRRVGEYMLKAVREAKKYTSWKDPNEEYEAALLRFVGLLLSPETGRPFLDQFLPFQQKVSWCGLLSGLSQVLLKLTSPGVPDIYQGNELWDLSLVDPDNRRPVDWKRRGAALEDVRRGSSRGGDLASWARSLLETIADGRAKLHLLHRGLTMRRRNPALFTMGEYVAFRGRGRRSEHLVVFARRLGGQEVIAAAPRWCSRLVSGPGDLPLGDDVWGETCLELDSKNDVEHSELPRYRNVLTGESLGGEPREASGVVLRAADLFRSFPVALLERST